MLTFTIFPVSIISISNFFNDPKDVIASNYGIPKSLLDSNGYVELGSFKDKYGSTPLTKNSGTFKNGRWTIDKDTAGHSERRWKLKKDGQRKASLDKNGKVVYLDEKAQAKGNPFCVVSDDYIKTLRTLTDNSFQTEVLKSQMKNNQTCTKEYAYGDYSYTLFEVPVLDGDYFLIIGAEQTYVNEQVHTGWRPLHSIALQIMAVLLVFIVVLAIIDVVEKNHENEKKKALEDKADTDLLTTLNNKIATERKIKEHLAAHPDEMAVMFVVDIDNFKKINDTMGHVFGDEVLKTLGKHICGEFRASDIIGRTGGDEFMVFLCNMKEDAIIKKEAKRLENFFQSFQAGSYVKYSATASIGAAVYPRDAQTFEGLYRAADQAMYVAKKKGKNRLAFYGEESTEP